jgi:hypothetical protein
VRRGRRRQRLLSVAPGVVQAAAQDPRAGQPAQQHRPLTPAIALGQHRQRPLRGIERLWTAVERPLRAGQPGQQPGVAPRIPLGVELHQGALQQHLAAGTVAGHPVRPGGQRQQADVI